MNLDIPDNILVFLVVLGVMLAVLIVGNAVMVALAAIWRVLP